MKNNAKKIVMKDNVITKIILWGIISFPICFVMIVSKANFISKIITSIIFLILFRQIKQIIEQRISTKPTFNEQYYRDIPNLKPAIAKYYIAKDQYEDIYNFVTTIL